jgi:hypothetical protein
MFKNKGIGELLLREKKITAHQLEEVLAEQKRLGANLKLAPLKN